MTIAKEIIPDRLTARKSENFPEWMSQIFYLAKIIDSRYEIKSMFVWMPYGYDAMLRIKALWDKLFKENGIKEMYFPLMVPVKYAEQNDSWWEGFKDEGFWAGTKDKQEFIIRPTGEPAMYPMFSLWIRGHSDLPLRIYETVFSYRYETKQTRPLIRDREIGPWYEIHTVHATKEEADAEIELARKMNDEIWKFIAIKPILVRKPQWECFPGAEGAFEYYTVMPNGKVLENGSLNNLGQAYAKKFNIKFVDKDTKEKYAWQTCTGNGERYLAAALVQHGDDSGLVLPPNIAPVQLMIIPIFKEQTKEMLVNKAKSIKEILKGVRVEINDSEDSVGSKFCDSEMKGIPMRIELGQKELDEKKLTLFFRHTREKIVISETDVKTEVSKGLKKIQNDLLEKSEQKIKELITDVKNLSEVEELTEKGKIARVYWCKEGDCYDRIVDITEGVELIGSDVNECTSGNCIICGKETTNKAYVAKSY